MLPLQGGGGGQTKGKTMLERILTKSALRVILSLAIGVAIGLKSPEAVDVLCSVANVLDVSVEMCSK